MMNGSLAGLPNLNVHKFPFHEVAPRSVVRAVGATSSAF
jgi:hypothetical protein